MAKIEIKPLTEDRWGDLEELFGPNGACAGCWCMYWRISSAEWKARDSAANKRAFKALVKKGPPPGLIAYQDGMPAGWVQVTPRAGLPRFNTGRKPSAIEDTTNLGGLWAISCFFVRAKARRSGLSAHLLREAIAYAKRNGAKEVDACPWDLDVKAGASGALYVGILPAFKKAGFKEIARRTPHRPLMRKAL